MDNKHPVHPNFHIPGPSTLRTWPSLCLLAPCHIGEHHWVCNDVQVGIQSSEVWIRSRDSTIQQHHHLSMKDSNVPRLFPLRRTFFGLVVGWDLGWKVDWWFESNITSTKFMWIRPCPCFFWKKGEITPTAWRSRQMSNENTLKTRWKETTKIVQNRPEAVQEKSNNNR